MANILLKSNNPYSTGSILRFEDGTPPLLERKEIEYVPSTEDSLYTLTEGETLTDVAGKFYGDSKLYWVIAMANGIDNPLDLSESLDLIIPPFETIQNILAL